MATNITTSYAGLTLKNPIIAAASPLTATADQCRELEKAGVAAIVIKSIFEQSIAHNAHRLADMQSHGEEADYLDAYIGEQMIGEWRTTLREIKAATTIPIIASIACHTTEAWVRYAKIATEERMDALELNLMNIGLASKRTDNGTIEQQFIDAINAVRSVSTLPITVKLAVNLTNPASLAERMKACGVKGIVLFNRPYPIDIDIEKREYIAGHTLSCLSDLSTPLRWTGLLSAEVSNIDYALSGGVHTWQDVVKAILAGASAVQLCSTLYNCGLSLVQTMLHNIAEWQEVQNEETLEGYRGKMNASKEEYADELKRIQYLHFKA